MLFVARPDLEFSVLLELPMLMAFFTESLLLPAKPFEDFIPELDIALVLLELALVDASLEALLPLWELLAVEELVNLPPELLAVVAGAGDGPLAMKVNSSFCEGVVPKSACFEFEAGAFEPSLDCDLLLAPSADLELSALLALLVLMVLLIDSLLLPEQPFVDAIPVEDIPVVLLELTAETSLEAARLPRGELFAVQALLDVSLQPLCVVDVTSVKP